MFGNCLGLQLEVEVFFRMGVSIASLRQSGIVPVVRDLFMTMTRAGRIWSKTCLISLAGKGSRLLDLIGDCRMILSSSVVEMVWKVSNLAGGGATGIIINVVSANSGELAGC